VLPPELGAAVYVFRRKNADVIRQKKRP